MATDSRLPDGCPPTGSEPAQGSFFRLARPSARVGDALLPGDVALPLYNKRSESYGLVDQCDAFAVSVCADMQDLLSAREILGWARRKSIARLDLSPEMGRTMQTPSEVGPSHHDWWPSEDDLVPPHEIVEDGRAA